MTVAFVISGHVSREELANRLVYAIRQSTVMVFFETYNEATADENYRGRRTAFNWQMLEQRYGANLLVVRPKSRTYYRTVGEEIGYRDNGELAQKISALVNAGGWIGVDRRVSEEPNFAECFAALIQQSEEYFGGQFYYSPQAGIALIAPEPPGDRSVALGDDVLVSLIRLSPRSAVALSAAGANCERVLAVGPDLSPFRWQELGSLRFADVFGHNKVFDASTLGVMDETALLLGILGYAAEGATASELLERALRLSGGKPEAEADDSSIDMHHVRRLYERVRDAIARDGRYIGRDQQWEVWREEERWRIRPCASAGVWQLSDPFGSERGKLTSLVVTQTEVIYRREEIRELEDLINAADASKLEEFLQRYPHLRMTLSHREYAICQVTDLTRDFPTVGRISLHSLESEKIQAKPEELQLGHWILETISSLAPVLSQANLQMKRVGPFSLHIRPVLVLGAPPQLSDTGAVAEHLDFRDLAISVLPTLWRYLRIRDVDPSFLDVKSESL
jgi:hypothetical protein